MVLAAASKPAWFEELKLPVCANATAAFGVCTTDIVSVPPWPCSTGRRRKHGCSTWVFGSSRTRILQFDPEADLYSLCCCFSDVSWHRSLATMPMTACRMAPPIVPPSIHAWPPPLSCRPQAAALKLPPAQLHSVQMWAVAEGAPVVPSEMIFILGLEAMQDR